MVENKNISSFSYSLRFHGHLVLLSLVSFNSLYHRVTGGSFINECPFFFSRKIHFRSHKRLMFYTLEWWIGRQTKAELSNGNAIDSKVTNFQTASHRAMQCNNAQKISNHIFFLWQRSVWVFDGKRKFFLEMNVFTFCRKKKLNSCRFVVFFLLFFRLGEKLAKRERKRKISWM